MQRDTSTTTSYQEVNENEEGEIKIEFGRLKSDFNRIRNVWREEAEEELYLVFWYSQLESKGS